MLQDDPIRAQRDAVMQESRRLIAASRALIALAEWLVASAQTVRPHLIQVHTLSPAKFIRSRWRSAQVPADSSR